MICGVFAKTLLTTVLKIELNQISLEPHRACTHKHAKGASAEYVRAMLAHLCAAAQRLSLSCKQHLLRKKAIKAHLNY